MPLLAGDLPSALAYNRDTQGMIHRCGPRTTSSGGSTSTAAVGYMRSTSGVAVLAGYSYTICVLVLPTSTVALDRVRVEFRGTFDGTAPTPASAAIFGATWLYTAPGAGHGVGSYWEAPYFPGTDHTLRLILCFARHSGTGTSSIFADATYPSMYWVRFNGPDPGNAGENL